MTSSWKSTFVCLLGWSKCCEGAGRGTDLCIRRAATAGILLSRDAKALQEKIAAKAAAKAAAGGGEPKKKDQPYTVFPK